MESGDTDVLPRLTPDVTPQEASHLYEAFLLDVFDLVDGSGPKDRISGGTS